MENFQQLNFVTRFRFLLLFFKSCPEEPGVEHLTQFKTFSPFHQWFLELCIASRGQKLKESFQRIWITPPTVISMWRNLQVGRKQRPSCQRLQTVSLPMAASQCLKGQLSPYNRTGKLIRPLTLTGSNSAWWCGAAEQLTLVQVE